MKNKILILDFGSQFTQLIARRIREMGVFSEVRACGLACTDANRQGVIGVILSGGPASVTDPDAPEFDSQWFTAKVPVLGVCYGMQLMAHCCGGRLESGANREYGNADLTILNEAGIFCGFSKGENTTVWMSHGDHVAEVPPGFQSLATSSGAPIAAMGNEDKRHYAVQFHPEVVHTPRGTQILENFVLPVVKAERNWTSSSVIADSIAAAKAAVPVGKQAICGLSGGVDSTVAAVLLQRALGDRLHCIFVDNGLLRRHERQEVERALGPSGLNLNLHVVDASQRFLTALDGVSDPEQKRKTIGRVFIEVFDEAAKGIPNVTHLVQGTLYPDVIESSAPSGKRGPSATIKSHHNVGGLPEKMNLKLLEPFRDLFKDEVRRLGAELEVPAALLGRQPFPGPGLAVRIIGPISVARLDVLRAADAIFHEEIVAAGLYSQLWQSFAVLLPVRSVGVMGDGRTYEETIALRAVTSEDGMTADWAYLPHDVLRRVSNRIINQVKGINRVVLDISSKPPATIEWE